MTIQPEALILRRCYPVPVTFADLRAACENPESFPEELVTRREIWAWDLKSVTGALDEVYAVVDGREIQVATVRDSSHVNDLVGPTWVGCARQLLDLLEAADQAGYWERPHDVRIDLETRPTSHDSVARAVMIGQEYAERRGDA